MPKPSLNILEGLEDATGRLRNAIVAVESADTVGLTLEETKPLMLEVLGVEAEIATNVLSHLFAAAHTLGGTKLQALMVTSIIADSKAAASEILSAYHATLAAQAADGQG